jgi:hypothetical protein
MNQNLIERYYIIPEISRLLSNLDIRKKVGVTHHLKFIKLIFESVTYVGEGRFTAKFSHYSEHYFSLIRFVENHYNASKNVDTPYKKEQVLRMMNSFGISKGQAVISQTFSTSHPYVVAIRENGGELSLAALELMMSQAQWKVVLATPA